jgi:hypothetical protein
LSSTESSSDNEDENYNGYFSKKRKLNNGTNMFDAENASGSNGTFELNSAPTITGTSNGRALGTPANKSKVTNDPDSGVSFTPTSDLKSVKSSNMTDLMKKIDTVKKNFRKNMEQQQQQQQPSDDSD